MKTTGLETQAALFDERNAVFVISGEEQKLGEIIEVNLGAVDMFGFTVSSELVGVNINTMMPSPFSGTFKSLMCSYG
jgi:PAS domain-containing protein